MLAELPSFYENVLEMRVLVEAGGIPFDRLWDDAEDVFRQRFVSTATWGLPAWEAELGIVPPAGQPIEQRRAVVRSKMRGYGKFTGRLLKSVAEAYDNGQIEVSFDPPSSTFTVRFVSTLGAPPNISDLQRATEEIVPAHLLVAYAYRYLLVEQLDGMPINDLEGRPLTDFSPVLPVLKEE